MAARAGKSGASGVSSAIAGADEIDSWDRANMTAASHTLSHQSAATGVEDGKDSMTAVGIDGKPKLGRRRAKSLMACCLASLSCW